MAVPQLHPTLEVPMSETSTRTYAVVYNQYGERQVVASGFTSRAAAEERARRAIAFRPDRHVYVEPVEP